MTNDSLGDRMKAYENCTRYKLPKRIPKILRLDGKAFHSVLRDAEKPYDESVMITMATAASQVVQEIGGTVRVAYLQSDECNILLNDALELYTEPWFDNNILKMCSVAAGLMSSWYTYCSKTEKLARKTVAFDARVFTIPESEIVNYFIWRQQDATRNSIQQYARSYFSHKQCENKSCDELQEMMFKEHGFNWNDAPTWTKRGLVMAPFARVEPYPIDWEPPKFTEDREYIMKRFRNEKDDKTRNILPATI